MAAIPAGLFRTVEWHLHHENELVNEAVQRRKEIIESVVAGCGVKIDGMPHAKGRHSEATADKALMLAKVSREVEQTHAWAAAIRETYDYFGDTPVFKMAVRYYGRGVNLRELAALMEVSEDTVKKMREKFVCTCAVFAAGKGLVGIMSHGNIEENM